MYFVDMLLCLGACAMPLLICLLYFTQVIGMSIKYVMIGHDIRFFNLGCFAKKTGFPARRSRSFRLHLFRVTHRRGYLQPFILPASQQAEKEKKPADNKSKTNKTTKKQNSEKKEKKETSKKGMHFCFKGTFARLPLVFSA